MADATLLQARDLVKRLGARTVVDRVSLAVSGGEVVGLLGPNGAGKTTIFQILMGLMPPDEGRLRFGDRDITRLPTHLRARLGLGYLPQKPSAFLGLTARQNLQVALELRGAPRDESTALLRTFGLEDIAGRRAAVLSGGERRRLELCRLVAAEPRVVLLDEPLKGLDQASVEQVGRLLRRFAEQGRGVLITDHSVAQTRALCDRIYLLEGGRVASPAVRHVKTPGAGAVHASPQPAPERRSPWHSN